MPKTHIDIDGRAWHREVNPDASSWRDLKWHAARLTSDRDGDFELEYRVHSPGDTPDTGWYLYGGGIFGKYMARKLADAITEAGAWISGRVYSRGREIITAPDHDSGAQTPAADAPAPEACPAVSAALGLPRVLEVHGASGHEAEDGQSWRDDNPAKTALDYRTSAGRGDRPGDGHHARLCSLRCPEPSGRSPAPKAKHQDQAPAGHTALPDGWRIWVSPNGVSHMALPDGRCVTCGKGPHDG
jgi:hypothetical protein